MNLLLENNVFRFGNFTLKSGRRSPYFYNARRLSNGKAIMKVAGYYVDLIEENNLDFDVIIGPSYAGIPLATAVSIELARRGENVRFVYDRKEIKNYGDSLDKLFVGELMEGDKAIIVDDMITDGRTKLMLLDKIKKLNKQIKVIALVILFDRGEKGKQGRKASAELEEQGLPVYSALKATEVFDYLHNKLINGKILVDDEIYNSFLDYMKSYGAKI